MSQLSGRKQGVQQQWVETGALGSLYVPGSWKSWAEGSDPEWANPKWSMAFSESLCWQITEMVQYENKMLEIFYVRLLGVYVRMPVCICALPRDGERQNEIDLIGYKCQDSAVTRLIDFSSHSSIRLVLQAGHTPSPCCSDHVHCISLFPDQQELGIPYASNDLIFVLTSLPCVLLKSQTDHLARETLGAHVRMKSPFH